MGFLEGEACFKQKGIDGLGLVHVKSPNRSLAHSGAQQGEPMAQEDVLRAVGPWLLAELC